MPKFSISVKPMFGDEFRDSGVVHDVVYHTWVREAGTKYADQFGGPEIPGRPTPVKLEILYSSPLLVTEEAKVSHQTTKLGRSSMTYENQITEAISGRPIATIISTQVYVDMQTGKSTPIPQENKNIIIDFEGRENIEVK